MFVCCLLFGGFFVCLFVCFLGVCFASSFFRGGVGGVLGFLGGYFVFCLFFVLRDLKQVRLLMARSKVNRNKQGLKRTLFNRTRQYNIHIFDRNIFVKIRTKQIKATETKKTYLNRNGSLIQLSSCRYDWKEGRKCFI